MRLILASASPRRRELLTQAGITFTVETTDVDESQYPGEDPVAYTTRLAREKAQIVLAKHPCEHDLVVLGADTTVTLDNALLGKPTGAADARVMLRALSGRVHQVVTGVALLSFQKAVTHAETTNVFFQTMTEQEIAEYIATGEPMDKAGAYGIQGSAARFIPRIEGDYSNVVGLPIAAVANLLKSF
jgi:septum formation protein